MLAIQVNKLRVGRVRLCYTFSLNTSPGNFISASSSKNVNNWSNEPGQWGESWSLLEITKWNHTKAACVSDFFQDHYTRTPISCSKVLHNQNSPPTTNFGYGVDKQMYSYIIIIWICVHNSVHNNPNLYSTIMCGSPITSLWAGSTKEKDKSTV